MCRNPVRDTSGIIWDFLVRVNIGLMLPSDCVQFQSDHVQSGVPAGQRVCGSQGRHLGPQRHQDPTCGARDSVCRYFLLCSCTLFTSYSLFFFLHFCGGGFVSSFIFCLQTQRLMCLCLSFCCLQCQHI